MSRIERKFHRNWKTFNFPEFDISKYLKVRRGIGQIRRIIAHKDEIKEICTNYNIVCFKCCMVDKSFCRIGCKIIIDYNGIQLILGHNYKKYMSQFLEIYEKYKNLIHRFEYVKYENYWIHLYNKYEKEDGKVCIKLTNEIFLICEYKLILCQYPNYNVTSYIGINTITENELYKKYPQYKNKIFTNTKCAKF